MRLSGRHNISSRKLAGIESTEAGIGVSLTARKYWRQHFAGTPEMLGSNYDINSTIAMEYSSATPVWRFPLESGEDAEIRQSKWFHFVAAIRSNGRHDVIVIQPTWMQGKPGSSELRLKQEWLSRKRREGEGRKR